MEHIKPQSEHFVEHGHETSDVNVKAILGFGIFLAVSAFVLYFLLAGFYKLMDNYYETHQESANPMIQAATPSGEPAQKMLTGGPEGQQQTMDRIRQTFPEPRVLVNEYADYDQYKKRIDEQLHNYAWIDKGQGRVRIPIDRAIELVAERGLPGVPAGNMPVAGQQQAQSAPGRKAPTVKR